MDSLITQSQDLPECSVVLLPPPRILFVDCSNSLVEWVDTCQLNHQLILEECTGQKHRRRGTKRTFEGKELPKY